MWWNDLRYNSGYSVRMVFLSAEQTLQVARKFAVLSKNGQPDLSLRTTRRLEFRDLSIRKAMWFVDRLVNFIGPFDRAVLWVTESGVWPSSENLHLYYRLRQAYGDKRLAEDAPGHLFLQHERIDLITFTYLCILNGWDSFLFTSQDYGRVFVSHDEWITLASSDETAVKECAAILGVPEAN